MNEKPQLKKMAVLAALSTLPVTVGELKAKLAEEYRFVESYVDYLVDHFVELKRIVKHEDGTVSLPERKLPSNANKERFRVAKTEQGFVVQRLSGEALDKALLNGDPLIGWKNTRGSAVKLAMSANFAEYKATADKLKALAEGDDNLVEVGFNEGGALVEA